MRARASLSSFFHNDRYVNRTLIEIICQVPASSLDGRSDIRFGCQLDFTIVSKRASLKTAHVVDTAFMVDYPTFFRVTFALAGIFSRNISSHTEGYLRFPIKGPSLDSSSFLSSSPLKRAAAFVKGLL